MTENKTVIALSTPIKCGDAMLHELSFRSPQAGDLRAVRSMDSPFSMILDLGAALADLPPTVIDRLQFDDLGKVIEVVSPFLAKLGLTGKPQSA